MFNWKRTVVMASLALSMAAVNAENVYQEDFSKALNDKPDALKKIVEVTDNPELKYALRLETAQDDAKKISYRDWSSSVFNAGQAKVVQVDYYMKIDTEAMEGAIYCALFVRDENKELVAVIVKDGQFECIPPQGEWQKVAPAKYGVWHHLRYVIELLTKTYSIYVDDMNAPKLKGMEYRKADGGKPSMLWTESSEVKPSVSSFGRVSVTSSQASPVKE